MLASSLMPAAVGAFAPHGVEVCVDHLAHQLVERGGVPPPEFFPRLGGIAEQPLYLGRPEITRVDLDQDAARRGLDPPLVGAAAAPFDAAADMRKGPLAEFS